MQLSIFWLTAFPYIQSGPHCTEVFNFQPSWIESDQSVMANPSSCNFHKVYRNSTFFLSRNGHSSWEELKMNTKIGWSLSNLNLGNIHDDDRLTANFSAIKTAVHAVNGQVKYKFFWKLCQLLWNNFSYFGL